MTSSTNAPHTPPHAQPPTQPQSKARSANASAGLRNLHQLIQLRWIAVVGQLLTIEATYYSLGMPLPLQAMLSIVAGMVVFNVLSLLRWRTRRSVHDVELFIALLVDVGALTAQLYLSGGIGNPFVFLYLLQIAVGAMLLRGGYIWSIVVVASACVMLLSQHSQPLPLATNVHDGWASPYVLGLLVCFMLNAILVVIFITRISHNLRRRDARLAAVRQRAAEEEHIVRMGLLASGAAHELGTPLATLAVILGDWKRVPALASDATLQEDIAEMEAQVKRCKTIVSGILLSAGETRGELSSQTTVRQFLDTLVQDWRTTRSVQEFVYDNLIEDDSPMVADVTLEQMVFNVLDNARDASPHWVSLQAQRDADALRIVVTDRGPGFTTDVLTHLGTPYQSTKGRPGGGLGLFLSMNVARTLGGSVVAHNRPGGGAEVTITLSLPAITLQATAPEDHGH
ncbi:two-component system sensor histidine kinase RegB [Acidovorax sp. 56]|uniref:ATP-binding protein n=1 Tax=Acidovorax sp. 56 TaxID=2035205 RepID=UPI000C166D2A|nr:ATP-binding protein [Acidovorax sp. 56]PIF28680.1 two-component system sensor histidine kinase RegB [Acidovorax sp. 56]